MKNMFLRNLFGTQIDIRFDTIDSSRDIPPYRDKTDIQYILVHPNKIYLQIGYIFATYENTYKLQSINSMFRSNIDRSSSSKFQYRYIQLSNSYFSIPVYVWT